MGREKIIEILNGYHPGFPTTNEVVADEILSSQWMESEHDGWSTIGRTDGDFMVMISRPITEEERDELFNIFCIDAPEDK